MAAIDWNSPVVAAVVATLAAIGFLSVLATIAFVLLDCAARRARVRRSSARGGVIELQVVRAEKSCAPSQVRGEGAVRRGGGRDHRQGGRT